ncbi:unnamed protein product [Cladocopium goreaui]|uniref:Uncharacterized protein n=2 Tax=Cladocopium goreaui TaxID=2562237 RepID=A0A9P1DFB8_9DINO|nr:unnamed protein product [Cladocopium goreaui]
MFNLATRGAAQTAKVRILPILCLVVLAAYACISLQGCLPPDWSFCDCDFRDNFWNSIINDVHLLWDVKDGADFVRRAQDNTTFQGKYLQSPPEDLNCPVAPSVFWKAWPQYGITRGLIEGSMGDLWMPGARDRFKQVCIAGHLALLSICSQHFLVKSARAQQSGDPDHMKWLEAAYSHMVAIRNLGQAYQIRNCMGQQGWSLDVGAFHKYTEKWIGREAEGTAPQAAFLNGKVDPWQMLFTKPMGHTDESRAAMLPDRKTCAPMKDPACWKRKSLLLMETCEYCCSPFQHKGGRGADICWDSEWTYERCCQQDFKDLICELNRKGEEGGCVDCKKSVTYICLTPTEKRLKDAQNQYNENVDSFNQLQNKSRELAESIQIAREDLVQKDSVYRDLHADLNSKIAIWHAAYHNTSRLSSLGRLKQQELTWNNSRTVLEEARLALRAAQTNVANRTKVLLDARRDEEAARQSVRNNFSHYERAVKHFEAVSSSLTSARSTEVAAEEKHSKAETAREEAEANASQSLAASLEANTSRDAQHSSTKSALEFATSVRNRSRASAVEYQRAKQIVDSDLDAARTQSVRFSRSCTSVSAVFAPQATQALRTVFEKLKAAEGSWQLARTARGEAADALASAQQEEDMAKNIILGCGSGGGSSAGAVSCLILKTPANQTKPEQRPLPLCVGRSDKEGKRTCHIQTGCANVKTPASCESQDGHGKDCFNDTIIEPTESTVFEVTRRLLKAQYLSQEALSNAKTRLGVQPDQAVVYVPSELTNDVEAKKRVRIDLESQQEAATKIVQDGILLLEKAKLNVDAEVKKQKAMEADVQEARRQSSQLTVEIVTSEEYLRTNKSFYDEKKQVLKRWRRTAESLTLASQQAFNRTENLSSQYFLAVSQSNTRRTAKEEAREELARAERNVQLVNQTLSDNLTVLVSAWLQQQDTVKASQSARWSERLLAAAKEVLVTMVGSLESFLDNYVISLSDKDAVLQLMNAVDVRKEAELRWVEAEKDLEKALEEVQMVNTSLVDAKVAHEVAQEKAFNATSAASEAEEKAAVAEELLNHTRKSLLAQQQQLEKVRKFISDIEEKSRAFAADLAAANSEVERQSETVRNARERAQALDAELVKATKAERIAEIAVANARAAFVGSTLADARKQCQPTDAQFEVYLHFRELLSLAKHNVVQRLLGLQLADQLVARQEAFLGDAQVARAAILDDMADIRGATVDRSTRLAIVDLDNANVQAKHEAASFSAVEAEERFSKGQERLDEILDVRHKAELAAARRVQENIVASGKLEIAEKALQQRTVELDAARNRTGQLEKDLLAAIQAEAAANASLKSSEAWQKRFNQSLQLERKEEALSEAKLEESTESASEAKASKREALMRASLNTHKRHLVLLDTQVELPQKTQAKAEARAAFDAAEKEVVEAQTKLDVLVKTESETHTKISETYKELERLQIEHAEAEKEYQDQDPQDRKRSFTTSLQGSGA